MAKSALEEVKKKECRGSWWVWSSIWIEIEALYEKFGLDRICAPSQASRVAVPLYAQGTQVGRATSTTWSPVLKKMIALASVETRYAKLGAELQMEITIEAVRQKATARLVKPAIFQSPSKNGGAGMRTAQPAEASQRFIS